MSCSTVENVVSWDIAINKSRVGGDKNQFVC